MATNRLKKLFALFGATFMAVMGVFGAAAPTLYTPWSAFIGTNGITVTTNPVTGKVFIVGNGTNGVSLVEVGNYFWMTNRAYVGGVGYSNLALAKAAATAGQVIEVMPGFYTNANLLKKGVNWYFHPGATVSVTNSGRDDGRGIFDDRDVSGGYQGTISGEGIFLFSTGLGGYRDGVFVTANDTYNGTIPLTQPTNMPNILGAIGTTNPLTYMVVHANKIGYTTAALLNSTSGAVCIKNCSNVVIYADEIYDPYYGLLIDCGPDEFFDVTQLSGPNGVYWELGEVDIHCTRIYGIGGYSFWFQEPAGVHTNSLFYEGNLIEGDVYQTAISLSYRSWFKAEEWKQRTIGGDHLGGSQVIGVYGGVIYAEVEKLGNETADGRNVVSCVSGKLYLTAQKVSALNTSWVDLSGGKVEATVQEWFDASAVVTGFNNHGGILNIHGGSAVVTNGVCLRHNGGTTYAKGLKLKTLTANANNNSVSFISDDSVRTVATTTAASPSGLILDGCWLTVPAIANAINATNTQFVRVMNTAANTNSSANVTFMVGPLTVNGTVQ